MPSRRGRTPMGNRSIESSSGSRAPPNRSSALRTEETTMPLPTQKTPPRTSLSDITALLYGPSKFGKSEFCSKLDGALFLATEPGLKHLEVFQEPINSWERLLEKCREVADGNHPFKTIILDTADNAYRLC